MRLHKSGLGRWVDCCFSGNGRASDIQRRTIPGVLVAGRDRAVLREFGDACREAAPAAFQQEVQVRFLEEFLSFTARVSKLESWQVRDAGAAT